MCLDPRTPAPEAGQDQRLAASNGADARGETERRAHPRLAARFPALVRWRPGVGAPLEVEALLEDISRGGVRLRLGRRLEPGMRLLALVRFTSAPTVEGSGALVAVRGRVLRVEPGPGGGCEAAVAITRYSFL